MALGERVKGGMSDWVRGAVKKLLYLPFSNKRGSFSIEKYWSLLLSFGLRRGI